MKSVHNKQPGMPVNNNPAQQRGAVLIVSLVMLTLLTIIGVSSMSRSSLELKVASNAQQHNIAFQAAQSRLAFASKNDDTNPINFLIPIPDKTNPPVQNCNPPACPNGGDWIASATVEYLDCDTGIGSSLEEGKGLMQRYFAITATGIMAPGGVAPATPARSTQVRAVRFPVKNCPA